MIIIYLIKSLDYKFGAKRLLGDFVSDNSKLHSAIKGTKVRRWTALTGKKVQIKHDHDLRCYCVQRGKVQNLVQMKCLGFYLGSDSIPSARAQQNVRSHAVEIPFQANANEQMCASKNA